MNWKQIIISLGVVLVLSAWAGSAGPDLSNSALIEGKPVAVVELFTSQGCSSCPAADKLLSELVQSAQAEGTEVYPLSFHVSYWNYLGWEDPFSRKEFSDRQRNYARALQSSVFTPQMVFNGSAQCVGSSKSQVRSKLTKALTKESRNRVKLSTQSEGNKVQVKYKIEGSLTERVLQVALVERMISIEVRRGENGGRTLEHDNVVRSFKTLLLHRGPSGNYEVELPNTFNKSQGSIIAYVQNSKTLQILGASQVKL